MDEQYYEKLLNIKTSGEQKFFNKSTHSYSALEALSKRYKFKAEDNIVDFRCGKGRLNFYINHLFDSTVTGIEMNAFFYEEAIENKKNYLKKHKKDKNNINFLNCYAEKYDINPLDNKFYFFNPFSIEIFRKVINNILISVEEYKRTVDVILYYPSNDYMYSLENNTAFELHEKIKLPYLYDNNPHQSFLIYKLDYSN